MATILDKLPINTSSNAGRPPRLFGERVPVKEVQRRILKAINEKNLFSAPKIGKEIGLGERQTRRYIDEMMDEGKLERGATGRIVKTVQQERADFDLKLLDDDFNKIKCIAEFIKTKQKVREHTLSGYLSALKQIFKTMKTNPATVLVSHEFAQQFFLNFETQYLKNNPTKTEVGQNLRVAYRRFLDDVGHLSYGHGTAKKYGFGSHHASFQKYKGVLIPKLSCDKISQMMLDDKEFLLYTWFNCGIMTGPRSSAMSTMIWERINLYQDRFILEQHETKDDSANDIHLGVSGEWKTKTPPQKLLKILLDYKENYAPKNSRFIWFEDRGSDKGNRIQAEIIQGVVIPKIFSYIEKIKDDLTPRSWEYAQMEAGHMLRHTCAQLLKNKGLSNEQIAKQIGWKSATTVEWYVDVPESEVEKSRVALNEIFEDD